jgi:hypothetical protein
MRLLAALGFCAGLLETVAVRAGAPDNLRYLVIAASSPSPAGIAAKARELSPKFERGFTIQTADCGEAHNVFAFVSGVEKTHREADSLLKSTRPVVPDAYVKPCNPKPGSLLAFGIPAVDSSIADVPPNAVNWSDQDRVSTATRLPDGRTLIIVRYYTKEANDPLEGRRERIELAQDAKQIKVLADSCTRADKATVESRRIAVQCATEQAGDHLLHVTEAFDDSGKKLTEIPRCRNPLWIGKNRLECEAESVGADGKLSLERKRTDIP